MGVSVRDGGGWPRRRLSGTGAEAATLAVPLTVPLARPLGLFLLFFHLPFGGLGGAAGDGRQSGSLGACSAALPVFLVVLVAIGVPRRCGLTAGVHPPAGPPPVPGAARDPLRIPWPRVRSAWPGPRVSIATAVHRACSIRALPPRCRRCTRCAHAYFSLFETGSWRAQGKRE